MNKEQQADHLEDVEIVYLMEAFDMEAVNRDGHWDSAADLGLLAQSIEDRFGTSCSEAALHRWKGKWQDRVSAAGRAEATVHWLSPSVLRDEGIQMDLYGQLREIEREMRIAAPPEIFVGVTIRRLRWWQMMLLTQDFPANWVDVVYLGERFLTRQLVSQYANVPLDYGDLRPHLSYAPWRGGRHEEAYLHAINSGFVPPLRLSESKQKSHHAQWKTMSVTPQSLLMEFGKEWLGDRPWRLLSQAHSDLVKEGNNRVTWSFSSRRPNDSGVVWDWELPVFYGGIWLG